MLISMQVVAQAGQVASSVALPPWMARPFKALEVFTAFELRGVHKSCYAGLFWLDTPRDGGRRQDRRFRGGIHGRHFERRR